MQHISPLLSQLIHCLKYLPGIGQRSAQRIAFSLLAADKRPLGKKLAKHLTDALDRLKNCAQCRTFSENEHCGICSNAMRNPRLLCIVEMPHDLWAIEQIQQYSGQYFVLMGRLSPIDGILPETLGLAGLKRRFRETPPDEVILATSFTVEGEVTAQYIAQLCQAYQIKTTRIAQGVPLGSELELTDPLTLSHALLERKPLVPSTPPSEKCSGVHQKQ